MTLARFDGPNDLPKGFRGRCWLGRDRQTVEITDTGIRALWPAMSYADAKDHDFLDSIGMAPELGPPEETPEPPELPEAPPPELALPPIRAQILRELCSVIDVIAASMDHADKVALYEATSAVADRLTSQLTSNDPVELRDACNTVSRALWSRTDPPPDWWSTPLGRACVPVLGLEGSESMSVSAAGAALNVSRSRVYQLIKLGKLTATIGGVTRQSVMDRVISGGRPQGQGG
jgi:hypothetical protein